MTDTFTAAFDQLYESMPDARVKLRIGQKTLERCLSSGLSVVRDSTEQGLIDVQSGTARFLFSDEKPEARFLQSEVIEFLPNGETNWIKCRVQDRKVSGGIVILELMAENE